MDRSLALVVAAHGEPDALHRALVDSVAGGLGHRREVRILDLPALGFIPRMSPEERRAYHGDEPILDPMVAEHAELVGAATVLAFVYPTRWWQPPAVLKAWLERVMVPGLAFVFDDQHRVRPNLSHLQAIAGVATYDMTRREVLRVGDGGRRMLLRALRANAPGKAKTSWNGLFDAGSASAAERERFAARVREKAARL